MPTKKVAPSERADEKQGLRCKLREGFRIFSSTTSRLVGTAWAFAAAILIIVVWGLSGPAFHYSDTWQLVINTGTTIVTFLMVFLIQNTQNRDAKAIHLKLDELIHAMKGARNELVDLEKLSDDDLKKLEDQFEAIHDRANGHQSKRAEAAENMTKKISSKLKERSGD